MFKKLALLSAAAIALAVGAQAADAKTLKFTHFQPGREDQPKHGPVPNSEAVFDFEYQ